MEQDRKITEDAINTLLIYMNDDVEMMGQPIDCIEFDFSQKGEDAEKLLKKYCWSYDKLTDTMKICLSRKYVEYHYISGGDFSGLGLTEEGQGRAISCINAKPAENTSGSTISIGSLVNNGSAQFGDNNTQNIENTFTYLIEQIDKSSASPEQKNEAKNLIKRILEHPVTSAIIGAASTIIAAKLGV